MGRVSVKKAISNKVAFELESVKTHFCGLTLDGLVLNTKKENATLIQIQSLDFKLNPISIIRFQEVPFHIKMYDGNINGYLKFFPDMQTEFYATNIQPNHHSLIRKSNIVLSNPLLQFEGAFRLSPQMQAKVKLNLQGLNLSGKMKNTGLPFDMPSTEIDSLDAIISFEKSQLSIDASSRGDITGNIEGTIEINQKNIQRSKLDLKMIASLNKDYQKKLGAFIELLNNYKNKTGQFVVRIRGTTQYPKFEKI